MVRARCLGIISRVATVAGIGRIVVVAVVAGSAVVGNSRVRPVQSIIVVVNRERSGFPARFGGMAHGTIRRDVQRHVVGVRRLVEICGMAGRALRWSSRITRSMALIALSRQVGACKREICRIVVKTFGCIPGRVANETG